MIGSRSKFSSLAIVLAVGLLAGCAALGPEVTPGPSGASPLASGGNAVASLPGEGAGALPTAAAGASTGDVTPTAAPGKTHKPPRTPTPTGQPASGSTDQPTDAPTDAPTTAPTDNASAWPAGAIAAADAGAHVGQTLPVCGIVQGANWLFSKPGHPTWLNFGNSYPNQNFNAVIWGEQRRAWPLSGKPDVVYLGHEICVTGLIQMYQTWPQIQDVAMPSITVIN